MTQVEISIPVFFRPYIQQILSIGKSIKIIRYLDKIKMVTNNESLIDNLVGDFKTTYGIKS